jgi:hypothetical protein
MARSCRLELVALRSLTEGKQTCRGHAKIDVNDPMRNSSQATKTARFCSAVGFGLLGREIILGGSRAELLQFDLC